MKVIKLSCVFLCLVLLSCSDKDESEVVEDFDHVVDQELCEMIWECYGFGSESSSYIRKYNTEGYVDNVALAFYPNGEMIGQIYNEYYADYKTNNHKIRFDNIRGTLVGGGGEDEYIFREALWSAERYEITDDVLKIYYDNTNIKKRFNRSENILIFNAAFPFYY